MAALTGIGLLVMNRASKTGSSSSWTFRAAAVSPDWASSIICFSRSPATWEATETRPTAPRQSMPNAAQSSPQ